MRAMLARSRFVLFSLCTLLLCAQVTGAHLHLCFDGQEPPVQLHLLDTGEIHPDTGFSLPHSDEDIALSDGSSARSKPLHFDLPPALVAAISFDLRPAVAFAAARRPALATHPAVRIELPPPARGPPSTSQA